MKGVKRFKGDVKFKVGQYLTRTYSIQNKW